jgi:hypothetical protein
MYPTYASFLGQTESKVQHHKFVKDIYKFHSVLFQMRASPVNEVLVEIADNPKTTIKNLKPT